MRVSRLSAFLFLLPALLLFAAFSWYPIARAFTFSFQDVPFLPTGEATWVGWENYRAVFADPAHLVAWRNVALFVGIGLVVGFPVPIALAVALCEMRRSSGFFRLVLYLPTILPIVVVAYLWKQIYWPEIGLIDASLRSVGLPAVGWLENPNTALLSLVLMSTWKFAGGTALIYLAALQGIPAQLYESAELDGAGFWRRLWHVTLPQLRFAMVVVLLLQVIATCQVFTEPFLMTDGGPRTGDNPSGATLTVLLAIYDRAFEPGQANFGQASAMSVVLFLAMVGISLVYLLFTRKGREA